MSKSNDDKPINAKKFMKEFHRYQNGSITRRHFLGVTGSDGGDGHRSAIAVVRKGQCIR